MPGKQHRRFEIVALALLGALLGAAGGYWLGHASLLRNAESGLVSYASELVRHADEYSAEFGQIQQHLKNSGHAFCSPEDIADMQWISFRSVQVKEIGRTRDSMFFCSAFLGRLAKPLREAPVTLHLPDGTNVFTDAHLTFAASSQGTILEFTQGDFDAVLSPAAYDLWGRPHMHYMVAMVDRGTHQMARIAGEPLPITPAMLVAGQGKNSRDDLYRTRCSETHPVCVATSESVADVMFGSRTLLAEYSAMGGIGGLGLGSALGLFYRQRRSLTQQLRRALREQTLHLVYQPVIGLPSGDCYGAEALARWSDEDGNPVSPEIFVRIAEESGLIGELTAFVIRRATHETGDVLRRHPELVLSINIAASDLEEDDLFLLLEEHVRQAGILPCQIALELTERSTADVAILREGILHLHQEGYQVHIDDFGTGFSSLAYLHELAVDAIKIDRTFTRTIGTEAVTASILPQILSLAESLGLDIIVEGVETEMQANYLRDTGKRLQAQGWYFGKPVTATELPKYREEMQRV
jgi:sensor c-di-GMP phosphodiesterase-like protein